LTRPVSKRSKEIQGPKDTTTISKEYFRLRDFEYAQPLYDLAFLIEVDALAKGNEVPKFRTFSLWRAGYSLDGYGSTIDHWLEGTLRDEDLDYVPSARIRQYLTNKDGHAGGVTHSGSRDDWPTAATYCRAIASDAPDVE
jgi:hypothetical protein